ncbi:phosphate signaling complex protein PhoU [Paracoccus sp. SY]|uniref:phosphate signaling complex protein PhoU n=1 Tax=Paracoccus sp. SY TaxID=1330255 RepID=UPI000CD19055|nr:phosphate signaling complex protein PhoU [Paracoccus sp. SY]
MEHTLKSFDQALDGLLAATVRMAEKVHMMVSDAGRAILSGDSELARQVVEHDLAVDRDFEAIRAQCLAILARFHPVARDLRQVMAMEHSSGDLERAADHAKGMAKRVIAGLGADISDEARGQFSRLHKAVVGAIEDATDALVRRDPELAQKVVRDDRQIDAIHDDLFHLVVAAAKRPSAGVSADVHLLFAAKSLERIGDHATNVAEEAMFMSEGAAPSATRKE